MLPSFEEYEERKEDVGESRPIINPTYTRICLSLGRSPQTGIRYLTTTRNEEDIYPDTHVSLRGRQLPRVYQKYHIYDIIPP